MNDTESFDSLDQEIRQRVASQNLTDIEQALGLPEKIILELIDEPSDWSFVTKLAVIVEAALTQAIASRLDTAELQKHLNRLPVGGRTGKIQLASDLEIIGPKAAARLNSIASLRNVFAHDISVIGLSLGAHIEALTKADNLRLSETLLGIDGRDKPASTVLMSAQEVRHVLWVAGVLSLADLSRAYRNNTNAQRWRDARLLIGEAFLAKQAGDRENYKNKLKEALSLLVETRPSTPASSAVPNPALNTDAPPSGEAPVS